MSDYADIAAAFDAGIETAEHRRVIAAMLHEAAVRETMMVRQPTMMPVSTFAERDTRLQKCRRTFYPDCTDNDASNQIADIWLRYGTTAWFNHRYLEACPPELVGTLHGELWEIMRILPRILRARSIRRIVGQTDVA